jgi:RNA polymerase sigma-70 factor (ECF subfamily)
MASSPITNVLQPVYQAVLLRDGAGLSDGQLLEGYVVRRDAAFFECLVRRHGPMVLGLCRRILSDSHDAEDAFQATFLVLAQRATVVMPRELVGNWLYGVAYRTALGARRAAARRRMRERQVINMPHLMVEEEETWQELLPLLDRELNRLPDKYRAPVVLCHLQGKSRVQAATELSLPVGTLSGRLTTAMRMLAKRLRRHGLTLSAGTLAVALSPQAVAVNVPVSLIGSTMQAVPLLAAHPAAAASLISAEVAALMKGALKSMLLSKLKLVSGVLLVAAAIVAGSGAFTYHTFAAGPDEPLQAESQTEPAHQSENKPQTKKSDKELLQGFWVPVASVVNGEKKDPENPKLTHWRLTFEGDKVTLPGEKTVAYTLDPKKVPKEMDIMVEVDGDLMKAIYEFAGEKRIKISWKKNGERPTDFDTTKNESVLIVFEKK